MVTVIWERANPADAENLLASTIRATLRPGYLGVTTAFSIIGGIIYHSVSK
jgi:hypothetical protein